MFVMWPGNQSKIHGSWDLVVECVSVDQWLLNAMILKGHGEHEVYMYKRWGKNWKIKRVLSCIQCEFKVHGNKCIRKCVCDRNEMSE